MAVFQYFLLPVSFLPYKLLTQKPLGLFMFIHLFIHSFIHKAGLDKAYKENNLNFFSLHSASFLVPYFYKYFYFIDST